MGTFWVISTHDNDYNCLLYTSDAADDLLCVDLGGRRIIKKNNKDGILAHDSRSQWVNSPSPEQLGHFVY